MVMWKMNCFIWLKRLLSRIEEYYICSMRDIYGMREISLKFFILNSDERFWVGYVKMWIVLISSSLPIIIKRYYEFPYLMILPIYLSSIFSWSPKGDLTNIEAGYGFRGICSRDYFQADSQHSVGMFCAWRNIINRFLSHTLGIISYLSQTIGCYSERLAVRKEHLKIMFFGSHFL